MKKLLLFIASVMISGLYAQDVMDEGTPISEVFGLEKASVPVVTLPAYNVEAEYRKSVEASQNKVGLWMFSKRFDYDLNFNNAGYWTTLPNGDRIWRLSFYGEKAKSLNFIFENYQLAEGAKLYFYSSNGLYLGDYTSFDNSPEKVVNSWIIKSGHVTLEFYEPYIKIGESTFNISKVMHGYRTFNENALRGINDSDSCNYDALCSQADGKDTQRKGTAALVITTSAGSGLCSGTLVNNTGPTKLTYVLTANHCVASSTVGASIFATARFLWWSTNVRCPGTGGAVSNSNNFSTTTSAILRMKYSQADTALIQWNAAIPTWRDVCYVGWDISQTNPTSSTGGIYGLHHPSGDVMRFSRNNGGADKINITISGQNSDTWRVAWGLGITEGGSSGSALYRGNTGKLIGVLFGGGSSCTTPTARDYYGRIHVAWEGGGTDGSRLKNWLDPANLGLETIDHFCNVLSTDNFNIAEENFRIYPNSSDGVFYIDSKISYDNLTYEVYSITGQKITQGKIENLEEQIDLTPQAGGVYLLKISSTTANFSKTYKLIKK